MRRGALAIAIALSLAFAPACVAQGIPADHPQPKLLSPASEPVKALAGPWRIATAGGELNCIVQLNGRETAASRMVLGSTPACKKALPVLTTATQWGLGEDGAVNVFKTTGDLMFFFVRERGGGFKGQYIDLDLQPIGGRAGEAPRADTVTATLNALSGAVPERDAKRAALTGVYLIARTRDAEGCAIELKRLPGPRPKTGGAIWIATLDANCADEGLRVFDPVGWQYDENRIFLVAKKGHTIGFTADGALWRKDPAAGKPLWLKRK